MNFEIINEFEAMERHDLFTYWSVDYFSFGKNNFLLFNSAISIDSDWDVDALCKQHNVAGLIIIGNLKVSGYFNILDSLVLIKGDLEAQHAAISDAELYITGSCRVAGLLCGGRNHGRFTVGKEICAQFLIYEFKKTSFGRICPETITIDHDFNSGCEGAYTYFWHELEYVFLPELHEFSYDGKFSSLKIKLLRHKLNKNEPVMKTPKKKK